MRLYKKVKFPFEVTKGKAEDLYRLRFMRKSELEPSVQHNLKHNVCQLGRQLDLWFKEQLFTIGSLNKEQEKIHQSRQKLKIEIRRSKKREYARQQEQIRIKLKEIKMKMLMMKVIQKFKENVTNARSYRSGKSGLKGNVDVLRVSGNRQLVHGSEEKIDDDIEKVETANQHLVTDKLRDKRNIVGKEGLDENEDIDSRMDLNDKGKTASRNIHVYSEEASKKDDFSDIPTALYDDYRNDSDGNDEDNDDDTMDNCNGGIFGQRNPSSRGPRMETIPEETEEVEVEMDDYRNFPKLTKRRLNLLNRSISKRNIFDAKDRVPLLPEISRHQPEMEADDVRRHLPDTADKETQTSDKSNSETTRRKKPSHLRKEANRSEKNVKKTIVVKLPRSKIPTPRERDNSARSNSGHCGSDDSDEDYNDETTDTDFAYGFESDLIPSETDDYVEQSEDDNDVHAKNGSSVAYTLPEEFSFSLSKYKTSLRRKAENNPTSQGLPSVTNIEASFPNVTAFSIQNPFSVRYKERSFVLKTVDKERATGSAKLERSARDLYSEDDNQDHTPRRVNPDRTKELKKQRSEEIRRLLMTDNRTIKQEKPNIAIFGRKPKGVTGPQLPSPPDSPGRIPGHPGFSPMPSASLTHQKNLSYRYKLAKAEEQEKIHNIVTSEPVQKYERTRSGKIRQVGTPRVLSHEIPSLREQYNRDKLLKAERDSILKQNMKMKKFIDTFDKGSNSAKLPAVSGGPVAGTKTNATTVSTDRSKKSLGNFLFKVYQPEQNMAYERKVVPGVATTSLRLLKNCRYLREYNPMTDEEKQDLHCEKKTSWDTVRTKSDYSNAYLANVRVNLI